MNLLHNASTLFVSPQIITGLIQVAVSSVLVVIVVLIAYWSHIFLGKETAISMVRGFVQMIIMGIILVLITHDSIFWGYAVLACMIIFAAILSKRRAQGLPDAMKISLTAIAVGSGLTIVLMVLVGVIQPNITTMIPVGSMIISSSMRTILDHEGGTYFCTRSLR